VTVHWCIFRDFLFAQKESHQRKGVKGGLGVIRRAKASFRLSSQTPPPLKSPTPPLRPRDREEIRGMCGVFAAREIMGEGAILAENEVFGRSRFLRIQGTFFKKFLGGVWGDAPYNHSPQILTPAKAWRAWNSSACFFFAASDIGVRMARIMRFLGVFSGSISSVTSTV